MFLDAGRRTARLIPHRNTGDTERENNCSRLISNVQHELGHIEKRLSGDNDEVLSQAIVIPLILRGNERQMISLRKGFGHCQKKTALTQT